MAEQIDDYFTTFINEMVGAVPMGERDRDGAVEAQSSLSVQDILDLFDSQLGSRHLDLAARWLRSKGKGFYTIGSSGHEGNAVVARALRLTDPALLHYRSGAFFLERARQVQGSDPLRDVLLGVVAAAEEPMSGGRHKVFGRHDLNIIPQTSTIASHLPRAVGVAFSLARRQLRPLTLARRCDRSVQFRRCLGQPLDRDRRHQHRCLLGVSRPSHSAAVRLRRQRHRDQHQDPGRVDRRQLRESSRARVLHRRRIGSADGLRHRAAYRRLGPQEQAPGVPASAHGETDGPRRIRRRSRLPHHRRDHRRLRPRSGAVHCTTADRARASQPERGACAL